MEACLEELLECIPMIPQPIRDPSLGSSVWERRLRRIALMIRMPEKSYGGACPGRPKVGGQDQKRDFREEEEQRKGTEQSKTCNRG